MPPDIQTSQLDLVKIAINGARNGLVKIHLLMAAPHTMDTLIKLPVVANDDLYSNASMDQFSLLTAAVGKLTSQVAELSKSSTSASHNHVTPRDQRSWHGAKPSDRRHSRRMDPYRHQQLCKRCSLKFCKGSRLLDWIGLDSFNDDTRPSGHISRPTQVNVSQSCFHSLNNYSSLIILYTSRG